MAEVLERFLDYVKINTESKDDQETVPSTKVQFELAKHLAEELKGLGAKVRLDEKHCFVYAWIPSNLPDDRIVPSIGFIAHMDTSPEISGKDVNPRVVDYKGGNIELNAKYSLKPEEFPELLDYVGKRLVVTDGNTLLGADDKAGVAEIMTMAEYFLTHKDVPHGKICIAFTPDEEVGTGVDCFDVANFEADYAYTVDGGAIGELEYENFNAKNIKVLVKGKSIHPGSAKGTMKNALLIGMEFQNLLPTFDNPAFTENYEGFYHLTDMNGGVDHAVMNYIIRDHDAKKFHDKVQFISKMKDFLNAKYGEGTIEIKECGGYRNMKEMIEPHMELIEKAKKAMELSGVEPKVCPIRGGTDGARLSFMGLPCPNLCTGGHNYHGRFEYVPVESMESVVEILIHLAGLFAEE